MPYVLRKSHSHFVCHPPDRIQRLEPDFDGDFIPLKISDEEPGPVTPEFKKPEADAIKPPVAAFAIAADSVIKRPGNVTSQELNHSLKILAAIPDKVKTELSDILGSILITCALLLDKDPAEKTKQVKNLQKVVPAAIIRQILLHENELKDEDPQLRLAIMDLALPSLRQMSARQYTKFQEIIQILVEADAKLSLFEFALQPCLSLRSRRLLPTGWERPSGVKKEESFTKKSVHWRWMPSIFSQSWPTWEILKKLQRGQLLISDGPNYISVIHAGICCRPQR
jgi:hypothetical protein